MQWQVQTAKQRFSELVERAGTDGDQIVTKRGRPVVAVVDYERYRALLEEDGDFKDFLRSAPEFDGSPVRKLGRHVEL